MKMINQITMSIIKNAKDGETIHGLAKRIGFAYSAVYRWVNELEMYDVLHMIRKGNKNIIKINKNEIYSRFMELNKSIEAVEKDKVFWNIIKKIDVEVRFVQSTAVVIWTHGSYITGDFSDRVYFLEVAEKDMDNLKKILKRNDIAYTEKDTIEERPLVKIIKKKSFTVERKNSLPVMPLQELVSWCRKLYLDSILEQLDELYNLNLKERYAEIKTNK
jgi:hypothetical protein